MGWTFPWFSSFHTDFNYDHYASFTPKEVQSGNAFYNYVRTYPGPQDHEGISVFFKEENDTIFHTYSCFSRGIDMVNATYQFLDLVPKGRDEDGWGDTMYWVRHHDRYKS